MDDGTVGPTEHLYETAREICATCPVQSQCLQEAVDNKEQYGMWGGAAPIGRKRIERKHRRRRMIERRLQEAQDLFEEDEQNDSN